MIGHPTNLASASVVLFTLKINDLGEFLRLAQEEDL